MWDIFYLVPIIIGISAQNIFKKPYTNKVGSKGVYWFNTILSLSAVLFFVVTSGTLDFKRALIPYAIGFAASYILTSVFSVKAISNGSLSLTSLFLSYYLIVPIIYGLFWLKESISVGFIPGIILLVVSLFLINRTSEKSTVSVRWIVYVILAVLGNGMCTVFQKMQQLAMDGNCKNEFMLVALGMVSVSMLLLAVTRERRELQACIKGGWCWPVLCGLMNGIVNLFVMILSKKMPISLMFPLVSSCGIVITALVGRLAYKEKMTRIQLVGFFIGIASVVFLNI